LGSGLACDFREAASLSSASKLHRFSWTAMACFACPFVRSPACVGAASRSCSSA